MFASSSFRFALSTTILLAATTTLSAQQLTLRGQLADGRATGCYYCPAAPYVIKFSETPVRSTTINLGLYMDMQLQLTGTWNTAASPPGLDVTTLLVVAESHSVGGGGKIGDRFRFSTVGTPGDLAITGMSLGNGFVPFAGTTALLISPTSLFVLGGGTIPAAGDLKIDLPIPNDAALVGLRIFSQSLIFPVSPSAKIYSTNPRSNVVTN